MCLFLFAHQSTSAKTKIERAAFSPIHVDTYGYACGLPHWHWVWQSQNGSVKLARCQISQLALPLYKYNGDLSSEYRVPRLTHCQCHKCVCHSDSLRVRLSQNRSHTHTQSQTICESVWVSLWVTLDSHTRHCQSDSHWHWQSQSLTDCQCHCHWHWQWHCDCHCDCRLESSQSLIFDDLSVVEWMVLLVLW